MHKIAIFVEGQTEHIFVKKLLEEYIGYKSGLKIKKITKRGKERFINITSQNSEANIEYFFLIIYVGNDEKVVSDIRENASNLFNKGFIKIIGLRDLHPNKREEEAKVIKIAQKVLNHVNSNNKIETCLAIMEIEAWFLADPFVFKKIDSSLTPSYIKNQLNYDLINDDPQITYNKPANVINKIYQLIGKKYKKKEAQSYEIVERIDYDYLYVTVKKQNKIENFFIFLDRIANSFRY